MFYKSLKHILQNVIHEQTTTKKKAPFHSNHLNRITTPAELKKNCLDYKYCVIAFFNTTNTEENLNIFENHMPKLEQVRKNKRNEDITFNWIDFGCHSDLAGRLGISHENKNVPGITFIYPWRSVYATFKGMWEPFILNEYLERALSNRYDTKEIDKDELVLKNLQCGQQEDLVDVKVESKPMESITNEGDYSHTETEVITEEPKQSRTEL
jgi:hypothetical protein